MTHTNFFHLCDKKRLTQPCDYCNIKKASQGHFVVIELTNPSSATKQLYINTSKLKKHGFSSFLCVKIRLTFMANIFSLSYVSIMLTLITGVVFK